MARRDKIVISFLLVMAFGVIVGLFVPSDGRSWGDRFKGTISVLNAASAPMQEVTLATSDGREFETEAQVIFPGQTRVVGGGLEACETLQVRWTIADRRKFETSVPFAELLMDERGEWIPDRMTCDLLITIAEHGEGGVRLVKTVAGRSLPLPVERAKDSKSQAEMRP